MSEFAAKVKRDEIEMFYTPREGQDASEQSILSILGNSVDELASWCVGTDGKPRKWKWLNGMMGAGPWYKLADGTFRADGYIIVGPDGNDWPVTAHEPEVVSHGVVATVFANPHVERVLAETQGAAAPA